MISSFFKTSELFIFRWVYECARQGKKLSESTYIVGLDEQSSILPDVPPIPTKYDVTGSSKSESTSSNDAGTSFFYLNSVVSVVKKQFD